MYDKTKKPNVLEHFEKDLKSKKDEKTYLSYKCFAS